MLNTRQLFIRLFKKNKLNILIDADKRELTLKPLFDCADALTGTYENHVKFVAKQGLPAYQLNAILNKLDKNYYKEMNKALEMIQELDLIIK